MTSDGTPLVEATGVSRIFGEGEAQVHALEDVSVAFPAGRFTAIMGPSGSGKSTLMHILAGLDRPTSGSVVLDGTELGASTTRADGAAAREGRLRLPVLQPAPGPDARGEHPPAALDRRAQARSGWVGRLIDTVGLGDRLTHRPSELSGGQQQRVAVARALASRPAVVFADEPTGNLDSKSSAELLELLRRSVDEFGQTIIMVTHDASAASYADRLLLLADGRIVHDGTAESAEAVLDLIKAVA
jgi:putative ABC transport system ATP-binding protein